MKRIVLFILCFAFVMISCANRSKSVNSALSDEADETEEIEEMAQVKDKYANADLPPLHEACNHDVIDKDLIRKLVAEGHDVNGYYDNRVTPIMLACNRSEIDDEAVKLLVELGATLKTTYSYEYSPMSYACNRSDIDADAIKLLIDLGAEVEKSYNTPTPLMMACDHDDIDVDAIRVLIENGANPYLGESAVMIALNRDSYDREAVKLLLETEANVRIGTYLGKVLMMVLNDLELTQIVVEKAKKENVNPSPLLSTKEKGTNVLSYAAALGNKDVVQYILSLVPEQVEQENDNGQTPLFFAAYSGNLEIVKLLVEAKADIHHKDKDGHTALMAACRGKDNFMNFISRKLEKSPEPEMIRYFLDSGIDAQTASKKDITALHYAVSNKTIDPEIIDMLIKAGADVNAQNSDKRTPLMFVNNPDVAEILLHNGANIEAIDKEGLTALHHAIKYSRIDIAKLLIKSGANIHAKTNSGKGIEDYAYSADIIELLASKGCTFTNQLNTFLKSSIDTLYSPDTVYALMKASHIDNISEKTSIILRKLGWSSPENEKYFKLIIQYLIDHGTDLNQPNSNDMTLLMQSCYDYHDPILLRILIKLGADINRKTSKSTAMSYCASTISSYGK